MLQHIDIRKRRALFRVSIKKDRLLYLMLLPGIAWFLTFYYVPMYGLTIAFRSFNIFQGFSNAPFVGLAVFKKLFSYSDFQLAFSNTIVLSLLKLACGFPVPILLSLMINEIRRSRTKKIVQTAIILPHFISWVVMGTLIYMIFSPTRGVIRAAANAVGYEGALANFLTDKSTFRMMLVWSDVWKEAGYGTIVYLGVITGLDPQLYEAAQIDGASWLRRVWHVTLPGIRATIVILFIFRMGSIMNVGFDQIFIMSNPLVKDVSEVLDTYVYSVGMGNRQYSVATAAGLLKSLIGMVLVFLTNRISNKIEPGSGIV